MAQWVFRFKKDDSNITYYGEYDSLTRSLNAVILLDHATILTEKMRRRMGEVIEDLALKNGYKKWEWKKVKSELVFPVSRGPLKVFSEEEIDDMLQASPPDKDDYYGSTKTARIRPDYQPTEKQKKGGYERRRSVTNSLGETIKVGQSVKSSEIFKELAKDKNKDSGYWLEFTGVKIKSILDFGHAIRVEVIANGHERSYNPDYVSPMMENIKPEEPKIRSIEEKFTIREK